MGCRTRGQSDKSVGGSSTDIGRRQAALAFWKTEGFKSPAADEKGLRRRVQSPPQFYMRYLKKDDVGVLKS